MAQVLRQLPIKNDPRLLVGAATSDDAGVYRIAPSRALVQTVDFFTPVVDDPAAYGRIAAANSLSDVYAMGGRPLTAMNLLGIPEEAVPPPVVRAILRGGAGKIREADCVLVGGHSVRNPEPLYGLSVTGLVDPRRMITNAGAVAGDLLVLTKPLGMGIATTGHKRGKASERLMRKAIRTMARLNQVGAEVAEKGWVRGGTDITGFGLLGHLRSLCRASGVAAEIDARTVPVLDPEVRTLLAAGCFPGGSRDNLETARADTDWEGVAEPDVQLLADAQTSGGLLLCVAPRRLARVLQLLRKRRADCAAVIGRILEPRGPLVRIVDRP